MQTETSTVYIPPDVRKESIHTSIQRIENNRARRMVMRQTFEQKRQAINEKIKDKDSEKFKRLEDRLEKKLQKIAAEINSAEELLEKVKETHANLTNVETHDQT
jgi:Mg2+ and Co2+ transporter CorA